jgi:thioredoxin 1
MQKVISFLLAALICTGLYSCSNTGNSSAVVTLTADEFNRELSATANKQILDVRTAEEFREGHLEGARNINFNDSGFKAEADKLDKRRAVFVYCLAGGRSAEAAGLLKGWGFDKVYDLKGGLMAWRNSDLPVAGVAAEAAAGAFSKSDLDKLVADNPVVLVDFYAEWCGPCKKMEPEMEKLAKAYAGKVVIHKVNVDEAKELANELKIESIPLLHLYRNGKLEKTAIGYQDEEALKSMLVQ